MPNTEKNRNIIESAELGESMMMTLMFISIVMTFVFQGAMKYYMYMIRILQLILHLPVFIIQAPANVSAFCSIMMPVANFDF